MTEPSMGVRIWEEDVTIPTYGVGKPNKNPMFLEKRVYQGSSGAVYPYPVIDHIEDEKRDETWRAVFLENEYLKIMVLPALGGRVQMALDKTNNYHFVYYNRVIKPALVGLAGPWISGGIEFNWPQHHRPSTYLPADYTVEEHSDGSKTLWVSEIERMSRMKGTIGFTLYPGKAFLELRVRLFNRTDLPQTFLWWANPAVAVNEDYQSVFPPDVHAVMDHGKRDVSRFPIATGTYYKVDYSAGVDISRYANIPVPTSYMAYHSDYDFVGGYDHGKRAGLLHVANHHVSPGKKQWTWGSGDFGRAWDRQLTDEDGPYFELMCGVYTDNQPDFSWLAPFEEKSFTQTFMPYKDIGVVRNASTEAALSLEVADGRATMGAYVTSPRQGLTLRLTRGEETLFDQALDLSPEHGWTGEGKIPAGTKPEEVRLALLDADGREVLAYRPEPEGIPDIPDPAQAALPPEEISTTEELYLTGLHLEQYRHATYDPEAYYREALKREPGDVRNNNALGLRLYRQGQFAQAEAHIRAAIKTLTKRNPNPYDGEPYYNLGLALVMQGRLDEAKDAFWKATWNAAWQEGGFFQLSRIANRQGRPSEALELVDRALIRNSRNYKARHLKTALLRTLQRLDEAEAAARETLSLDPLNYGAMNEQALIAHARQNWRLRDEMHLRMANLIGGNIYTPVEMALDYVHAGFYMEAVELLYPRSIVRAKEQGGYVDPMALYVVGFAQLQNGNHFGVEHFTKAAKLPPDYCFPNALEMVPILTAAMEANPEDARAPYYLGNFWYAKRQHEEAIACWERARDLDPSFPTVHRNLGLAYFNKRGDAEKALEEFETAYRLDETDARVLYELDQLYKRLGRDPAERLAFLDRHPEEVASRDDLTIERVTLLNRLGRHREALDVFLGRRFHPWEGGEGKPTGQYVLALVETAKEHLRAGRPREAIDALNAAQCYPENLGEGKLAGAQENHIHYWLGKAYEALGNEDEADAMFARASVGLAEPASAMFYNDQPPDMIFYQGLALRELGREGEARGRFHKLIDYGEKHLDDDVKIDYFAVSLPDFLVFEDDLNRRNRIHCHYMMGLGYLGLGDVERAWRELDTVLEMDVNHLGAWVHGAQPGE